MKTTDLLILLGAGGLVLYLLSRQAKSTPGPSANANTGARPTLAFTSIRPSVTSSTDLAGLVTAGSGALKSIVDTISPWFNKSQNSLSSAKTAAQVNVDVGNKSTWVDAPATGNGFDVDYTSWV